ncbi:putative CO dehydrogenase/acetyl-CoA synthase subunit gamma [groundwater metagenome]|uniref:Putative CO dehydrogenase/acetyl-CoA synthase subunit gamma n=1 Tax=groundwater metagenome TaxID=717931 RepID=A0A098E9L3_9ZZZZ
MARLSALQLYKLLPKTNCGKCPEKTCMAFAMKLMERGVKPEDCAELKGEKLKNLTDVITPPVRDVVIGNLEHAITVGGEEVIYRHDLRFFNPTGMLLDISDTMSEEEIKSRVEFVKNYQYERIGKFLKLDGVSVRCASNDKEKFSNAVKFAVENIDKPIILCTTNPEIMKAGLEMAKKRRPLIYTAIPENLKEMFELAKKYDCPLAIHSENLNEIGSMTKTLMNAGWTDIVIDPGFDFENLSSTLNKFEILRTAAIKNVKEFSFPIMVSTVGMKNLNLGELAAVSEALALSLCLDRFISLLVLSHFSEIYIVMEALTLRMNIYADPKVNPTTEPKVYPIGTPDENSPLLITSNFALTYFGVAGDIESGKVSCYLLVIDTEGLAVLVALAGGKLNAVKIKEAMDANHVEKLVKHRKLIIPGYVGRIKGAIEDETKWGVLVGPQDSGGIGDFLRKNWTEGGLDVKTK